MRFFLLLSSFPQVVAESLGPPVAWLPGFNKGFVFVITVH